MQRWPGFKLVSPATPLPFPRDTPAQVPPSHLGVPEGPPVLTAAEDGREPYLLQLNDLVIHVLLLSVDGVPPEHNPAGRHTAL